MPPFIDLPNAKPCDRALKIGKKFGAMVAPEGITMNVPVGQNLSLIGRNGAGKTMVVNMKNSYLTLARRHKMLLMDEAKLAVSTECKSIASTPSAAPVWQQTSVMARKLADGPREALGRLKRLIRDSVHRDLRAQLDAEAESFMACARTPDFAEGLNALLEKRPPQFGTD